MKVIICEHHPNDNRIKIDSSGTIQTLTSRMGTGGGNVPIVIFIKSRRAQNAEDYETWKTSEVANTLNTFDGGDVRATTLIVNENEMPDPYNNNFYVRRLTPLECERLQGFPDGWTNIGEWIDSKGKKRKTADSARYKALGNSIALPFWFYLLRRISAQYERPATLGSLFDGIGGFPLCWERCNGPGSARWASEIEEFPIAVTKKHFPEKI